MPLMKVLLGMEREGVRLDKACLARQAGELQGELERSRRRSARSSATPINVNSSKQVGEALFDELQIMEKAKKTKTGGYTTSEEVLEKLRDKHPVVGKILDIPWCEEAPQHLHRALPTSSTPMGRSIRPSTRPSPPRVASPAATPTSRISPSVRPRVVPSARPSYPMRAVPSSAPTTRRSSCV